MYVPQPDWHCHSEADINLLLIQTGKLWVPSWWKTLGTALDAWAWGCVHLNCCQLSHYPTGRGPAPGQTFCAFFLVPTMSCNGCMILLLDRWGNWSSEGLSKAPEITQPVESLKLKSTRCKNSQSFHHASHSGFILRLKPVPTPPTNKCPNTLRLVNTGVSSHQIFQAWPQFQARSILTTSWRF